MSGDGWTTTQEYKFVAAIVEIVGFVTGFVLTLAAGVAAIVLVAWWLVSR